VFLLGFQVSLTSASCIYDTRHGATYDLSTLQLAVSGSSNNSYSINDKDPATAYYFQFNICSNIEDSDAIRQGKCAGKDPAPAYQLSNNPGDDMCYRLGGDYMNVDHNVAWSVHNPDDPAGGVVLQYLNGDTCLSTGTGRRVDLHFICRDDRERATNIPDEEYITEPNKCEYSMEIMTGHGCPQECPRVDGLVCGGTGVCGYDTGLETARCFCDIGYEGSNCQSHSSSSSGGVNGETIALVFVCLLLALVIALLAYMWNKLRRLQLDPDAYSQLGNKFNELGQVSNSQ